MNTNEIENDEINLLEYWNVIWRRKYLLIALFIIFVTVTMLYSFQQPKFYKSDTVIMSTTSEGGGLASALSALPFAGVLGGGGIQTTADKLLIILRSRTTSEEVIQKFDLLKVFYEKQWDAEKGTWKDPAKPPFIEDAVKLLTGNVAQFNKSKEGSITITVEWKDPKLAADIANYYVTALTEFLKEKSINITIQIVDRAVPAKRKSRPKIGQNMMLAGVMSLFIGIFVVFFLEYLAKQKKA